MAKESFRSDFRRFFFTGLAALLPTILTLFILAQCYKFADSRIGKPINNSIKAWLNTNNGRKVLWALGWFDKDVVLKLKEIPELKQNGLSKAKGIRDIISQSYKALGGDDAAMMKIAGAFGIPNSVPKNIDAYSDFITLNVIDNNYPGFVGSILGVLISVIAVYMVGSFLANQIFNRIFNMVETFLFKFPVVRIIYPYAKQVTDFLFSDKKARFNRVVAVQYPRKGIYSMGFLTGDGLKSISNETGEKMVNVFIPSSPTPITGYVIFVPEREIINLSITVDEAFRLAISGGVIIPPSQVIEYAQEPKKVAKSEEKPEDVITP